ncbi:EpsG family protein [Pullulanibacillus sp. KACC 23026]|uniref:EpsG family protein n=1 Tax=Pullulanibacillus sp. KACC 23026 TaxID=3028315 RepID=UPI0023B0B143|nr:EpsG family protein [Pullulanibacillus sp. KACC 23026]WEG11518.1 EpsG family protein [Pullulanibacillus sp. KACC 23026]
MEIIWLNLGFVYLSSFLARYFSYFDRMKMHYTKPNKILIFFVMLALVLVSGLRNNIGDTYFYIHSYEVINYQIKNISFKDDFGFFILQSLLHKLSNNPQILIFVTALITNVLIVIVLYKYSRMIEISFFIYFTSGMYTVSMNGIRQFLASSILFAATPLIIKGDWKKFMLIVLFAATIHRTALIFIPIYFIVRKKAWSKWTFLLLISGLIMAIGFTLFQSVLFDALSDTEYGHYSDFQEGGANIIRVFVTASPLLIAYLGRDKLREIWPESDYFVNLSILGLVFMIVSTKNWIFARFDIYFGLYNLILFSWILFLFVKKQRQIIYFLLIICYLGYFYYEQVISLDLQYGSTYLKL